MVTALFPDHWSVRVKHAFRIVVGAVLFIAIGVYWLSTGEKFDETAYRWVICRFHAFDRCHGDAPPQTTTAHEDTGSLQPPDVEKKYASLPCMPQPRKTCLFEQALTSARALPSRVRVDALKEIALSMKNAGRSQQATKVLSEAYKVAHTIEPESDRTIPFVDIAQAEVELGHIALARSISKSIRPIGWRATALRSVVQGAVDQGNHDLAVEAMREAMDAARAEIFPMLRRAALREAAVALGRKGEPQFATGILGKVEEAIDKAEPDLRDGEYMYIAGAYLRVGSPEEAVKAGAKIKNPASSAAFLWGVVQHYAETGKIADAMKYVPQIKSQYHLARAWIDIGRAHVKNGAVSKAQTSYGRAKDVLQALVEEGDRAIVLAELAEAYFQASMADEARLACDAAVSFAASLDGVKWQRTTLAKIAKLVAKAGDLPRALAFAVNLRQDDATSAMAVAAVAEMASDVGAY